MGLALGGREAVELEPGIDSVGGGAWVAAAVVSELGVAGIVVAAVAPEIVDYADSRSAERFE